MKKIAILVSVLLPCLLAVSCNKEKGQEEVKPAVLGIEVNDAQALYSVPKNQATTITLAVVADPVSEEAYTITVGANPGLVASYNSKNSTSYEMLPSDAYSFTSTSVMLPRYSAKSTNCELRLKGEGCEVDKTYLLPVVIDGVQGGTNFTAPEDKAAYILFKMLKPEQQGAGTQEDPYLVEELEGFLKIGSLLKDDATVYFKMMQDFDFKDVFTKENPWTPINAAADDDAKAAARKRQVVFDGNNHKISNFKAGGPIFAILCGSVQNLTIEGADIDSDAEDAAILVGVAGASDAPEGFVMKNITVTSSKVQSTNKRAGALVSHLRNGVVDNCTAACPVTAQQQAGGLIGRVDNGTITNCTVTGDVTLDAYYGGGLVGYMGSATLTNCHASGNVRGNILEGGNYARVGGLVGQLDGNATIEKCSATGNVFGGETKGHMAGGLIGVVGKDESVLKVSKCFATGNVSLPHGTSGNWAHAGGFIGTISALKAEVSIDNCYSTGSVEVRRYSGGFIGSLYDKAKAPKSLTITNCFTTSDISGIVVSDRCGLVLGLNDGANGEIPTVITCTGFVAWNKCERPFSYADCVPVAGNYYGTEGTVSAQAKALGWDENIWDLSKDVPTLK